MAWGQAFQVVDPDLDRPLQLLTLVYYGLRDGQVRCLAPAPGKAG
jgi:hypothetical protein